MILLPLFVAGALGACGRHGIDRAVQRRSTRPFPLGIFVVNISGAFALGVVAGLLQVHTLPEGVETVLAIGFLGSFTTFSTYAFDTVELCRRRQWGPALMNGLGSVIVGIAACGLGLAVGINL